VHQKQLQLKVTIVIHYNTLYAIETYLHALLLLYTKY